MPELSPEAMKLIEQFAAKFQTTSEHIYGVLLKQCTFNIVHSLCWMIIGIIMFFVIVYIDYFCMLGAKKEFKKHQYNNDAAVYIVPAVFLSLLGFPISLGMFGINLSLFLQNLINPEYVVLQQLMDIIK